MKPQGGGFWPQRRSIVARWFLFLGTYITLLVFFFSWPATALDRWLIRATAFVTASCLDALGFVGRVDGDLVVSSLSSVRIISECTAIFPAMIFVAAVVAYPARRKLAGIAIGIPALLLINQVRLVSLFVIAKWLPSQFERMHVLVWPSLLVFSTLLLLLLWATLIGRTHDG